jgi:hypothetical protein
MRKLIFFIPALILTLNCLAQDADSLELYQLNQCLVQIDRTSQEVSKAYRSFVYLRDTINHKGFDPITFKRCGDTEKKDHFKRLFNELLCSNHAVSELKIRVDKLDEKIFSTCDTALKKYKKIKAVSGDSSIVYHRDKLNAWNGQDTSQLFITSLEMADASPNYVEVLLYEIGFDTIDIKLALTLDSDIKKLVTVYNSDLRSVGRRMGHMILSAVNEDPDYVSPSSQTRLDLARSDLDRVELFLRQAIHERIAKLQTNEPVRVVNNIILDPKGDGRNDFSTFVGATTDLKDAVGLNFLFSYHRPEKIHFDFGIDAMFRFVHEGDFLIHPKLGIPIDNFHFLIGLLGSPFPHTDFTTTLTGNIYYSKDRLFTGIGIGQNTILFTVGFAGGVIK